MFIVTAVRTSTSWSRALGNIVVVVQNMIFLALFGTRMLIAMFTVTRRVSVF
jgi:hypothetical protein